MKPNSENFDQIDRYLTGQLPTDQETDFAAKLTRDEDLTEAVAAREMELIDLHLTGQLEPQIQTQLQTRIDQDPPFAQKVEDQRELNSLLWDQRKPALLKMIKDFGEEQQNNTHQDPSPLSESSGRGKVIKFLLPIIASIAAAVLVLFYFTRPPSTQKLVERHYFGANSFDASYLNTMGGGSATEKRQLVLQAVELYGETAYDTAVEVLESALELDPVDYEIVLFKGICEYYAGEYTASKTTLRSLLEIEGFWEQASWYLAGVYLSESLSNSLSAEQVQAKTDSALTYLQPIAESPDPLTYQSGAKEIIEVKSD